MFRAGQREPTDDHREIGLGAVENGQQRIGDNNQPSGIRRYRIRKRQL
jgi:hypothetical protein